jgi:hemoglobin
MTTTTSASAPTPTNDTGALFARLGGDPAVKAAMNAMFERIFADPNLAPMFERVNKPRHVASTTRFVAAATGGPEPWTGRDIGAAHRNLGITDDQFDRVVGHLAVALHELSVPSETAREVLMLSSSLRSQIVA